MTSFPHLDIMIHLAGRNFKCRALLCCVRCFICSSLENKDPYKGAHPTKISQISFYGKFSSTKVLYKQLYLSAFIFFTTSKLLTFTFSRIRLSLR